MIDLLRLCRLYYAVPMALTFTLTVCYAADDPRAAFAVPTILATIALALVIAAAYVFNDVCDVAVDRVNAPDRPLAAGRIQRRTAAACGAVLMLAGLACATFCRLQYLIALAGVAAVLIAYDVSSKRLGCFKQIVVAALMTSIYPLAIAQAGGASGPRADTLFVFPVWMFLTALGYEGIKDTRDVSGDSIATAQPTWIQKRPAAALRMFGVIAAAGSLVLIAPAFLGCGRLYAVLVAPAIVLGLLIPLQPIRRGLILIYAECVVVGIAATADLLMAAS